jgi:addiction module RelE/StbE family toxin
MAKIVWTDLAKEDLRSIYDYISRDSKVYAERYVVKLISRVDQLESNPKSGRIVPEVNREEIRELIEGNYRIVYKCVGESVTMLRVHHSARQLKEI